MSWFDAARAIIDWTKDKQEQAIIYHLLKYQGRVEQVAQELNAPQATVVLCRSGLERAGYLTVRRALRRETWSVTADGEALLKALKADRGEE